MKKNVIDRDGECESEDMLSTKIFFVIIK